MRFYYFLAKTFMKVADDLTSIQSVHFRSVTVTEWEMNFSALVGTAGVEGVLFMLLKYILMMTLL